MGARDDHLRKAGEYSYIFEISPCGFKIRRKKKELSKKYTELGFDNEGIRNMDEE